VKRGREFEQHLEIYVARLLGEPFRVRWWNLEKGEYIAGKFYGENTYWYYVTTLMFRGD
jgi:hypothetical protein